MRIFIGDEVPETTEFRQSQRWSIECWRFCQIWNFCGKLYFAIPVLEDLSLILLFQSFDLVDQLLLVWWDLENSQNLVVEKSSESI